jgi:predicted acetyltransferase
MRPSGIIKQEFSASSWRSNQGYTKMHGQQTIKICNAKQARQIYQNKKINTTLYKNNAAIWYNKTRI